MTRRPNVDGLGDPSRFSEGRRSSPRDPGPSSRTATVRRSFFRRALASLLDRVVPSSAVELDGLDGARVEVDRARVRGELPVEPEEHYRHEHYFAGPPVSGVIVDEAHVWPGLGADPESVERARAVLRARALGDNGRRLSEEGARRLAEDLGGIGFVPIVQEWTPEGERVIRSARFLSFGPALDGLGEISLVGEDVPEVEVAEGRVWRGLSGFAGLAGEGLVDYELDPYPRPPFVEGVFVGHDHASLRELDAGRRRILSAMARLGFAPVVLGDGSCLRCGAVRFERSGWSVPAGFVFEGFAPGRPMCEPCALRVAVSFGDDVWLAEEFVVEPGEVEGRLRIRPTEIVVVPAGEVAARIEEGRR